MPGFLIQTGKIQQFPVVFLGREFWQPLLDFLCARLVAEGTIDPADFERVCVNDSAEEAVQGVTDIARHQFGLTYGRRAKRHWFLWE